MKSSVDRWCAEVYGSTFEYNKEHPVDSPIGTKERTCSPQAKLVDWIKMRGGCSSCGFNEHPAALDFHHVDGSTKIAAVSSMVREKRPVSEIAAEVEKCIILCANCHRIFHATRIE